MRKLLSFPDPVNDVAARAVAVGVVVMSAIAVALPEPWLLPVIAYGFWARALTGPKLSPLGLLATRVVAPRLGPARPYPGPPKRFAQGMGTAFSTASLLLWFAFGEHLASRAVLGLIVAAASLEGFAGYCIGCRVFNLLMRVGLIPESVCQVCADLSRRHPELAAAGPAGER